MNVNYGNERQLMQELSLFACSDSEWWLTSECLAVCIGNSVGFKDCQQIMVVCGYVAK